MSRAILVPDVSLLDVGMQKPSLWPSSKPNLLPMLRRCIKGEVGNKCVHIYDIMQWNVILLYHMILYCIGSDCCIFYYVIFGDPILYY